MPCWSVPSLAGRDLKPALELDLMLELSRLLLFTFFLASDHLL